MDLSKIDNVVLGGVDLEDYPDFSDAFIVSADNDGVPMTEEEIDELNEDSSFVHDCVMKELF